MVGKSLEKRPAGIQRSCEDTSWIDFWEKSYKAGRWMELVQDRSSFGISIVDPWGAAKMLAEDAVLTAEVI
jgi:hypothetical protein